MNILFVCKANRFRSRVAEAIFNHYNKDEKIVVKSAGVRLDPLRDYVASVVINTLKEKGIKMNDDKSKPFNENIIKWADKIIIVADNVSPSLFPAEKTEVWLIPDADESEINKVKTIIDKIEDKIKEFLKVIKV
ncbi:hypothetical protein HYW75_01680 [Candidatus Pacearchaeota archaeon]|nr:hypothetical protein [Candidatus Pacearchaeota archaeon]